MEDNLKNKLTKNDKKEIAIAIFVVVSVISIFLNVLAVSIINDLTLTANGYKSDRNVCRMEIDEMVEEEKIRNGE